MTKKQQTEQDQLQKLAKVLRAKHERLTAQMHALGTQWQAVADERAATAHRLEHVEAALEPVEPARAAGQRLRTDDGPNDDFPEGELPDDYVEPTPTGHDPVFG